MKNLPITVMSKINMNTQENTTTKPNFNALDFKSDGERITVGIVKIQETQQSSYDKETKIWSPKMEVVTKFNPESGESTTVTRPVKGFVIEMYRKDDPECIIRTLKINTKAGVKYMETYIRERESPIDVPIKDEEMTLEKIMNGTGMYPSVLPTGA